MECSVSPSAKIETKINLMEAKTTVNGYTLSLVPALLACVSAVSAQSLNFDFESDTQGWICDFADYPKADSVNWHLRSNVDVMPDITPKQNGIFMKGDNFSDDLFFFIKNRQPAWRPMPPIPCFTPSMW